MIRAVHILFSHGQGSGPWGRKITALSALARERGCEVESLDYQDLPEDAEARVERLCERLAACDVLPVLVGSSMGGYVSTVASTRFPVPGLFLMAPALYISPYAVQAYDSQARHIEVVHGWADTVIPVELSMRFARDMNCTVHMVAGDHRLADALPEVSDLFDNFLDRVQARGVNS